MKVEHIAITVTNIEKSAEFYLKYFGFKLEKQFEKNGSQFWLALLNDFKL